VVDPEQVIAEQVYQVLRENPRTAYLRNVFENEVDHVAYYAHPWVYLVVRWRAGDQVRFSLLKVGLSGYVKMVVDGDQGLIEAMRRAVEKYG